MPVSFLFFTSTCAEFPFPPHLSNWSVSQPDLSPFFPLLFTSLFSTPFFCPLSAPETFGAVLVTHFMLWVGIEGTGDSRSFLWRRARLCLSFPVSKFIVHFCPSRASLFFLYPPPTFSARNFKAWICVLLASLALFRHFWPRPWVTRTLVPLVAPQAATVIVYIVTKFSRFSIKAIDVFLVHVEKLGRLSLNNILLPACKKSDTSLSTKGKKDEQSPNWTDLNSNKKEKNDWS